MPDERRASGFELSLPDWQRRAIALFLLAIPVVVLALVCLSFTEAVVAHHARMATLGRERSTYQLLIRDLPLRRAEIARLRNSQAMTFLFPSMPASAAAVEVQKTMEAALKGAGAVPGHSDVEVQLSEDSPVVRIQEKLSFACDIATLTKILHAVELSRPALLTDRLSIRDGLQDFPNAAASDGPHRLEIDLTVSGYVRMS